MARDIFYGTHVVSALLEYRPEIIKQIFIPQSHRDRFSQLLAVATERGVGVTVCAADAFEKKLPSHVVHQSIAAECASVSLPGGEGLRQLVDEGAGHFFLVIDGVCDPRNLGAIVRVANAMGVDALLLSKNRGVGVTPVVAKASAGAIFDTPLYAVSNLVQTLSWMKKEGIWVVGADLEGSVDIKEVDLRGRLAMVLGSEGEGMRALTRKTCDHLAHIPMSGSVQSMNVSTAAGIFLYEARRQRGQE